MSNVSDLGVWVWETRVDVPRACYLAEGWVGENYRARLGGWWDGK